jgi:protocatechuate 3,4-dioxygenase alpha subunit
MTILRSTIEMIPATTSQTIGPYWHLIKDDTWADLTRFGARGDRIVLTGRIIDGDGAPVTDACVELWQASPPAAPDWDGFGRAGTDSTGSFRFITLKPDAIPVGGRSNAMQAPHGALTLFARGLLIHLQTRVYFEGESLNEQDPLLQVLPAERRGTLIARREGQEEEGLPVWRLDIRLQGGNETVFLDI